MNKVTAYFSHCIRGKKSKDATNEDMERNCAKAMKVATWIRENVLEIDLYVPAEHEEFVLIAYEDGYLTEKQILEIDCRILAQRDFHIVHEVDGWLGGGIAVEIDEAKRCGKTIFYISSLDMTTLGALRVIVKDLLSAKTRNRNKLGIGESK